MNIPSSRLKILATLATLIVILCLLRIYCKPVFDILSDVADIIAPLAVTGVAILAVIPKFQEKFFEWFPRISIKFKTIDGKKYSPYAQKRIAADTVGWYYRLSIENSGIVPLTDANVRAISLDILTDDGKRIPLPQFNPVELHWANDNLDSARDIHPSDRYFVDIVHTTKDSDKIHIYAKSSQEYAGNTLNLPPGRYYLQIRVNGRSSLPMDSRVGTIYIWWPGDWEKAIIELVEDAISHEPHPLPSGVLGATYDSIPPGSTGPAM